METKIKYLGQFKSDYKIDLNYEKDWNEVHKVEFEEIMDSLIPAYVNVEDDSDYYESDLFMRHNGIIEGIEELGEIHGIMGETNTSSIILKWDDSCDGGKLWRIY